MSAPSFITVTGQMIEVRGDAPGNWVRHEDYAALEAECGRAKVLLGGALLDVARLRNELGVCLVASCTCHTKTPFVKYHDARCRFRRISEILQQTAGGVRAPQGRDDGAKGPRAEFGTPPAPSPDLMRTP